MRKQILRAGAIFISVAVIFSIFAANVMAEPTALPSSTATNEILNTPQPYAFQENFETGKSNWQIFNTTTYGLSDWTSSNSNCFDIVTDPDDASGHVLRVVGGSSGELYKSLRMNVHLESGKKYRFSYRYKSTYTTVVSFYGYGASGLSASVKTWDQPTTWATYEKEITVTTESGNVNLQLNIMSGPDKWAYIDDIRLIKIEPSPTPTIVPTPTPEITPNGDPTPVETQSHEPTTIPTENPPAFLSDFESGTTGWEIYNTTTWINSTWGNGNTQCFSVDDDPINQNGHVLKVTGDGTTPYRSLRTRIQLEQGARYKFSYRYKSEFTNVVSIYGYGAIGMSDAVRDGNEPSDWAVYEKEVIVGVETGIVDLQLNMLNMSGNVAYIDDIKLEKCGGPMQVLTFSGTNGEQYDIAIHAVMNNLWTNKTYLIVYNQSDLELSKKSVYQDNLLNDTEYLFPDISHSYGGFKYKENGQFGQIIIRPLQGRFDFATKGNIDALQFKAKRNREMCLQVYELS